MNYDLYSDFDIVEHKNKYIHYLEVIILEDGTIEYAIPSHQEKLISILMKKYNWSRSEVLDNTPKEYYLDWMKWLCMMTKSVAVWYDYVNYHMMNRKQYNVLKKLKLEGLYAGKLPTQKEIDLMN